MACSIIAFSGKHDGRLTYPNCTDVFRRDRNLALSLVGILIEGFGKFAVECRFPAADLTQCLWYVRLFHNVDWVSEHNVV